MTDPPRHELPKAYVPADFESAIYERWLAADVFAPDGAGSRADPTKPPIVILQPPPNITGVKVAREPCGRRPIARHEEAPNPPAGRRTAG